MGGSVWQLLVGQQVEGKYQLTEFLGAGSFGGVFQADHVVGDRLMRTVAVKLIAPPEDKSPEQIDAIRDRQLAELQLNAMLDHPHIVRCYSVGECQLAGVEYLYIALELGEKTLEERLGTGTMNPTELKVVAQHLASALAYLHGFRGGLVHRDLKPANVLLFGDDWKLSDLGTVRGLEGAGLAQSMAIGTANYAPPESYEGQISPAWDVWSLGVILVEALSGKLPYAAKTAVTLMQRVLNDAPQLPANLPPPFDAIVPGCLAKQREERWTAQQVLNALVDTGAATGALLHPVEQVGPGGSKYPTAELSATPFSDEPAAAPQDELRAAVREAFSDKQISAEERTELNRLRRQLGIDLDTAVGIFIEEKRRALGGEPPAAPVGSKRHPARQDQHAAQPAAQPAPPPQPRITPPPPDRQAVQTPAHVSDEPAPTLVVGPQAGAGIDHTSINQALAAADSGWRINLLPGLYREHLELTRPVTIASTAGRGQTVLECTNHHGLLMRADKASIKGISILCRSTNPEHKLAAAFVARGELVLDDCDINSQSYAVVLAAGQTSRLMLIGCKLHGTAQLGTGFVDQAGGVLAGCEIAGLETAGLFIGPGADPLIKACQISNCRHYGVMVHGGGGGRLENCDISGCGLAAIEIRAGGQVHVAKSRITGNRRYGVVADSRAGGQFEGCDLFGNAGGNWRLAADSRIVRLDNRG